MPGSAGGDIESLSGPDCVGFSLCFQGAAAFQDKVDKMVGFHIKAVLISRAALLNAAVIELQGQETDSSPVDEKIPVSEHGSTSFLFFTLMIFYHGKRQNSRGWQEDVRF